MACLAAGPRAGAVERFGVAADQFDFIHTVGIVGLAGEISAVSFHKKPTNRVGPGFVDKADLLVLREPVTVVAIAFSRFPQRLFVLEILFGTKVLTE